MRDMRGALQVFVSDKKQCKRHRGLQLDQQRDREGDEMIGPEEQVLLIGCSAAPQMCVKKDETAFMGFLTSTPTCPCQIMPVV